VFQPDDPDAIPTHTGVVHVTFWALEVELKTEPRAIKSGGRLQVFDDEERSDRKRFLVMAYRRVAVHSTPAAVPQPGKSVNETSPVARPPGTKRPLMFVLGPVRPEPLT
jgi:hypothetical protein